MFNVLLGTIRRFSSVWLLCATLAHGATPQEIIDGAKRERVLVLYASLTLEEANVLLPKFEAKYPFLKVQFARAGSERLLSRVLTEARAKKSFADVVQTVEFSMHTLKVKGVLGRYHPLEGAVYAKDFKEEDFWTTFYYHPYVVAYNKNLLPQTNVPKTYHPNAARLYVDFVLSKEGQSIMRGFHRLSARTDLAQEQAVFMKDLRIVPVNPNLADQIDEYSKLLREIFSK
jgi:ABC-type Fe3+ transport system substrate-binding protein